MAQTLIEQPDLSTPTEALATRVEEISGISMGLDVFPRTRWFSWSTTPVDDVLRHPLRDAFTIALLYIGVFCCFPGLLTWLGVLDWGRFPRPYLYQVYGAFWAAWATASTKLAAKSARNTIQREILPYLSEATAEKIELVLRGYDRRRTLLTSLFIGAISAAAGGSFLYIDLGGRTPKAEIIFWSLGWFLLLTTSANVVNIGQFYAAFSRHLTNEAEQLFRLDPSRSSLILSLSSLGQSMLLFWFGIAFSIALIVPVAMVHRSSTLSWHWSELLTPTAQAFVFREPIGLFVTSYLVTTSIFSIGLGTIVFLTHEAGIRRAVRSAVNIALRSIETASAGLIARETELTGEEQKRLDTLLARHAAIAASGSYRSAIISGISLVLPLVLPVVTAIAGFWHKG